MKTPFLYNENDNVLNISNNSKNMDYRYNMQKILGQSALKDIQFERRIIIFTRYDDPEIDYLGKEFLKNINF